MKKVFLAIIFILLISSVCATTVTLDAASGPGTAFDNQYIWEYDYNNADVMVEFGSVDNNFKAHIWAEGLKPYFTYQIKLEGPGSLAADPDEVQTNENIGLNGRWWYNGNRDDTYYFANKDSENIVGYIVFDWFTTDVNGDWTGYVYADGSYHVLWCGATSGDNSYLYNYDTTGLNGAKCNPAKLCYPGDVVPQIERPGFTGLPEGTYEAVIFVLNEESFHQSCGTWTTAMTKEIDFEIDSEAELCGNGIYEPENDEECDNGEDGNRDDMNPVWTLEQGQGDRWYCSTDCVRYFVEGRWCGDQEVNGPEECDDGNKISGDSCSANCIIEEQTCDVSLDFVNIGDIVSEEGHEVIGWSEPWWWGGGYGGGDDGTLRTVLPRAPDCQNDDKTAYFTMFVDGTAEVLELRHLMGSQNDDYELYIYEGDSWVQLTLLSSDDETCVGGECWYTDSYDLGGRTGKLDFKIFATLEPIPSWCVSWGINAFSWAEVYGCEPQPEIPEFGVIGAMVVLALAGIFVVRKRKAK